MSSIKTSAENPKILWMKNMWKKIAWIRIHTYTSVSLFRFLCVFCKTFFKRRNEWNLSLSAISVIFTQHLLNRVACFFLSSDILSFVGFDVIVMRKHQTRQQKMCSGRTRIKCKRVEPKHAWNVIRPKLSGPIPRILQSNFS